MQSELTITQEELSKAVDEINKNKSIVFETYLKMKHLSQDMDFPYCGEQSVAFQFRKLVESLEPEYERMMSLLDAYCEFIATMSE